MTVVLTLVKQGNMQGLVVGYNCYTLYTSLYLIIIKIYNNSCDQDVARKNVKYIIFKTFSMYQNDFQDNT